MYQFYIPVHVFPVLLSYICHIRFIQSSPNGDHPEGVVVAVALLVEFPLQSNDDILNFRIYLTHFVVLHFVFSYFFFIFIFFYMLMIYWKGTSKNDHTHCVIDNQSAYLKRS